MRTKQYKKKKTHDIIQERESYHVLDIFKTAVLAQADPRRGSTLQNQRKKHNLVSVIFEVVDQFSNSVIFSLNKL